MRYTIITPTLLRDTLTRLCDSIDRQTCMDWQHIVAVDDDEPTGERPAMLLDSAHPQRLVLFCGRHRNWGNIPRHMAWDHAQGDYLLYVDDDNYLADDRVLETLLFVTDPVALFPLEYRGQFVSPEPIMVGRSDGNGLMVRRGIGRWPTPARRSNDGELIVRLTREHPYQVFRDRALVVYEMEGEGRP